MTKVAYENDYTSYLGVVVRGLVSDPHIEHRAPSEPPMVGSAKKNESQRISLKFC